MSKNNPNLTPIQKEQIKKALLKYYFENRPKWYAFHIQIRNTLGLPENDKRLHERDPRNWIIDDIQPSIIKLSLYEAFIRKTYSDFEFQETEAEESIDVGLFLSKFSMQSSEITDKRFHRLASHYDRKLYAEYYKDFDDKLPENYLCTLAYLRQITGTPFLKVSHFDVFCLKNASKEAQDLMNIFYGGWRNYDETKNVEAVTLLNSSYELLTKQNAIYIEDLKQGVLSPYNNSKTFHGIVRAKNEPPIHIRMKCLDTDDISVKSAGNLGRWGNYQCDYQGNYWNFCPASWNVEKLVTSLDKDSA